MKKAPSQSKKTMKVRVWYAENSMCWLSWEDAENIYFASQPIEQAG